MTLPAEEGGEPANVIAWIWARTVNSPDPSWGSHVPLVRSWILRKAKGNKAVVWVEPVVNRSSQTISYRIRTGEAGEIPERTIARSAGICIATGTPIPRQYLREEAQAGRMGTHLIAIVTERHRGRAYVGPTTVHRVSRPDDIPSGRLSTNSRHMSTPGYGLTTTDSLFTNRQLVALTTFSDLLVEVRSLVENHARATGLRNVDDRRLRDGGSGVTAYADAIATYLAFAIDRCADLWSSLVTWNSTGQKLQHVFGRQAIPMAWDYAEANPFSLVAGNWSGQVAWVQKAVATAPGGKLGEVLQRDAVTRVAEARSPLVSTDPPYYDNVPYADLSDFFYVWLRHNLRGVWPEETATLLTPKADELVADPEADWIEAGCQTAFRGRYGQGSQGHRCCATSGIPGDRLLCLQAARNQTGEHCLDRVGDLFARPRGRRTPSDSYLANPHRKKNVYQTARDGVLCAGVVCCCCLPGPVLITLRSLPAASCWMSCPANCPQPSAASNSKPSPPWTWPSPPSDPAWSCSLATPKSSKPTEPRCPSAPRWPLSTKP